jgi:hypothetical protein
MGKTAPNGEQEEKTKKNYSTVENPRRKNEA